MILLDKMLFKKLIYINLVRMIDIMFDRSYIFVYYVNY